MVADLKQIQLAERRVAAMRAIVIEHPRMEELYSRFEALMEHARQNPTGEKQCLPMTAPSGSGKTTITQQFTRRYNTAEALSEGKIPILNVTLKAPATRKSFFQDALLAIQNFGWETDPFKGTEGLLQDRLQNLLRACQTQLLFIDEFQHLVLTNNDNVARAVGETIKGMLQTGVCPIAISGTDEALKPFRANAQLVRRSIGSVSLAALKVTNQEERNFFMKFLGKYLLAMESSSVACNATALINGDVPGCIHEVSAGILGVTCGLLEAAVRLMSYGGRDELSRGDLIAATDMFVIDGKCERNPFTAGVKPTRIAA